MKQYTLILISGLMVLLLIASLNVSAEGQKMEKTDPDDDVIWPLNPLAEKPDHTDDLEILSASIDWSGDQVVCEFTVKGEVTNVSTDGMKNTYHFNIDIHTDNNEQEIWFVYTDTGFSGGSEIGLIDFCDDDFTSAGGTFTFDFPKEHMDGNPDVLDIEVVAMNTDMWLDEIQWDEGFVDDDDDTSDDDDDDTSDDDDETNDEEEDDSPGFSFFILIASIVIAAVIIGGRRRRD